MKQVYLFHSSQIGVFDKLVEVCDTLKTDGYLIVPPDEWLKADSNESVALLTFDDGYESSHVEIGSFLKENSLKAISFLIPFYNDITHNRINWDYWREWTEVFEVGSHSLTHSKVYTPNGSLDDDAKSVMMLYNGHPVIDDVDYGLISREWLPLKNRVELYEEYVLRIKSDLWLSRNIIERNMGKECRFFAYPWGRYNKTVKNAVQDVGYKAAFTVNKSDDDIWTIPRTQVC